MKLERALKISLNENQKKDKLFTRLKLFPLDLIYFTLNSLYHKKLITSRYTQFKKSDEAEKKLFFFINMFQFFRKNPRIFESINLNSKQTQV